ncbi:MAG: type II secretion system GspH family protein [Armatimonadetes bacterium]|nr:type II secretion system GspH family protein [Armatimonadota bacterium]MDW8028185.1 type II secretion system protein [Armatimonadota bacterium]
MKKKRKGLTLVELLIVTVIIIALTSIALSVYQLGRERARMVECMNNLRQIHLAWQMCVEELGHIPESYRELFGVHPEHSIRKQFPDRKFYTGPWWRYAKTRFDCPRAISLAPKWFPDPYRTGTYSFPILDFGSFVKKGLIKREPKYPPDNAAVAICDGILCRAIGVPSRVAGLFHDLGVDLTGRIGRIVPPPEHCDAFIEFTDRGKTQKNIGWVTIR